MPDKQTITLDVVIRLLKTEYTSAVCTSYIKKPMSCALRRVLEYVERTENERDHISFGDVLKIRDGRK